MYDNILGTDIRSIDNKYRVVIPKFAGAKPGEKLVLILKKDYLEIRELSAVISELKKIVSNLENTTNVELINFYQYRKDEITSCIGNVVTPDKQGRIILGKEISMRYNFGSEVKTEGIMDGLRIWNSTKFNEYQENIMNKKGRK